ncbi:MAG: threonine synthase [Burkholderiales bacterium]|nr:threonine synthase [Burkholderiales bacterium]
MKYLSTRGDATGAEGPRSFCDILLEGLAPDGGLYLPVQLPQVDAATLARWRGLHYAELAFEILRLFIDDIPPADLERLCRATYTESVFGTPQITPLRPLQPLGDGLFLQALSNGPTLAFKDMAMQLLGALFEYELGRRGTRLNILGATSGDTGSAAEHAMRGKRGLAVFMLSPAGRMSPFQQAQMYSLQDANIHNLAVDGVFDDCQDIVKAVSADLAFKRRWQIGTVNSINWARLLAQVVYYFAGYFQATTGPGQRVSFAVPSGNFGNLCAGHLARMMGLPISRLVLATNENDVLDEFFRTGTYRVRAGAVETSSPSMDISRASNFERFVFELLGRDPARTRALFEGGSFTLAPEEHRRCAGFGIVSGRSTHADRLATMREVWARCGLMVDPHTACGLKVALEVMREHPEPGVPMIVLETAQPAKFEVTLREALGPQAPAPGRPPALQDLESRPRRCTPMPADAAAVKRYIETHAVASAAAA